VKLLQKQDGCCACIVTLRGVGVTIWCGKAASVTHYELVHAFISELSSKQSACGVLYHHLWFVSLYHTFGHYCSRGTIL